VGKIQVVIADDHHEMLAAIRRLVDEEFEVVGAVEDGEQAVTAVLMLNPDVLVIDISMPILNGLQVAKQLQAANCRTKVIILSVHEGPEFVEAAFSAGASGYVAKDRLYSDLIPAVHEALGHAFVSEDDGDAPAKSGFH
jgi:DNA-binding NarL/FixJ family response regulator